VPLGAPQFKASALAANQVGSVLAGSTLHRCTADADSNTVQLAYYRVTPAHEL
jgi:hypothetical protein